MRLLAGPGQQQQQQRHPQFGNTGLQWPGSSNSCNSLQQCQLLGTGSAAAATGSSTAWVNIAGSVQPGAQEAASNRRC
jgi:hypothetical protein